MPRLTLATVACQQCGCMIRQVLRLNGAGQPYASSICTACAPLPRNHPVFAPREASEETR